MFVPRALRLKGVKETQKPKTTETKAPEPATISDTNSKKETNVEAAHGTSVTSATPAKANTRGPRFNFAPITPEYMAQLATGVDLILTDYAHQEPEAAKWLRGRYRTVDGEDEYIHLSAVLEHTNITSLKPQATQVLLRQAVQEDASQALELSNNGFYIRRRPSTYPSAFVPKDSFHVVDDNGISFWDQRTIYVEPHIRHLCKTPAKVAHWLKEHGEMKTKWLPIQAIHTLYNSCAFVVLSGNVTHEDVWKKWREARKPEDWKIMTKVEHTKRTEEYLQLLRKNNANMKRQRNSYPEVADSTTKPPADIPQDVVSEEETHRAPKKRKRTKNKKQIEPGPQRDANVAEIPIGETNNVPGNKCKA